MISHRNLFLTVMLAVSQTMCIWGKRLPVVAPEKVGLSSTLLQRADSAILQAIAEKEIPGAVLCVVRHDRIGYLKAYGNKQVWPEKLPMETGTVFDMASCSKSMSTAISVLILAQEGKIRLLDPVSMYVPGFQNWKDEDGETTTIRIQHLLTHTSGLPAYASVAELEKQYKVPNPDGLIEHICKVRRRFEPETDFCYSCLNFITLQRIVENVSGQSLRTFAREHIFGPLGMDYTDYLPCAPDEKGVWRNTDEPYWARLMPEGKDWRSIVAPTTRQADASLICGMVHDPLARIMNGGISGNAGVFTSAEDVAILCTALQHDGEWDGKRILSPLAARLLRTVPRFAEPFGRTYGWDNYSAYASCNGDLFSDKTYCHTGFTGTEIVIDPVTDCSVIMLINAVHPDEGHGVVRLRSIVSNAVAASIIN